jgi:hypothetical protein
MLVPLLNDACFISTAACGICTGAGSNVDLNEVLVVLGFTIIGEQESCGEVLVVVIFELQYFVDVGGPYTVGTLVVVEVMVTVLAASSVAGVEVTKLVGEPYNFPTGTSPVAVTAIPIFAC